MHTNPTFSNNGAPAHQINVQNNVIDYCCKLFHILIIHAFNENIHQGKISKNKAKQKYNKICGLIKAMYRFESINGYAPSLEKLLKIALKIALCSKHNKNQTNNDINNINVLSNNYFISIEKRIKKAQKIADSIAYDSNTDLKESVLS